MTPERDCGLVWETRLDYPPLDDEVLEMFRDWHDQGRLGFLDLPFRREYATMSLEAAEALSGHVDHVLVDGIGGSALGLRSLLSSLRRDDGRVVVLDSPDPVAVSRVKASCDPRRTLLCPITKSGGTAETMAVLLALHDWLPRDVRDSRIVAVTDPERGDLRRLSSDRGWRSLPVPPDVGGRYSVLSPVGLFPAALAGIDVHALLDGAEAVAGDLLENGAGSLPARVAACSLSRFRSFPVHVMFAYEDGLLDSALWFCQLWAESLGKRLGLGGAEVFTGQTPLACRGPADQHSLVQLFMEGPADKFFTFVVTRDVSEPLPGGFDGYPSIDWLAGRTLAGLRAAEASATAAALTERGLPVTTLSLPGPPDERAMGAFYMLFEIATVLTGLALGIDPLDQPGVERGKYLTFREMGRPGWS